MSIAALFAGTANGYFEGVDWKDQKAREKKLDAYRAAAEGRAAERFDWDRQDRVRAEKERALAEKDRMDYRSAIDAMFQEEVPGASAPTQAIAAAQPAAAVNPAAMPGAPAPGARPPATREPAVATSIPVPNGSEITAAPIVARRAMAEPPSAGQPARQPAGQPDPVTKGPDDYTFEEWQAMDRGQRAAAGLPVSEIGGQWKYRNRYGGWDILGRSDAEIAAERAKPKSENQAKAEGAQSKAAQYASAVGQSIDDAAGDVAAWGGRFGSMMARGAGYATSLVSPDVASRIFDAADQADASNDRLAAEGFVANGSPESEVGAKRPAPQPKEQMSQGTRAAASEALGATPPPAKEVAAATIAALGATAPNAKMTPAQVDRAVKAGSAFYREQKAQEVVRVLMRQGHLDQAIKFQEWIDTKETQAGMESWLRATVAASVGDFDGFGDAIVDAYNRMDYFGDNLTIDRAKSGFEKDDAGNIIGAKISFRDETTGATFEKAFDDPNDLIRMGITMLAPERAFEWHLSQLQQAQELGAKRQATAEGAAKDAQKRIEQTIKDISEADPNFAQLPLAEQVKIARQRIAEIDAAASGAPGAAPEAPVLHRPRI